MLQPFSKQAALARAVLAWELETAEL